MGGEGRGMPHRSDVGSRVAVCHPHDPVHHLSCRSGRRERLLLLGEEGTNERLSGRRVWERDVDPPNKSPQHRLVELPRQVCCSNLEW
jgi:hypothetical protein